MKTCIKKLFLFPASFLVLALTLAATLSSSAAPLTPPSLTITEPKTGAKTSNDVYTVTGTVKAGTFPVSLVLVSVNGGDYGAATLSKTSWTNQIGLVVGTNTINAYAVDTNLNSSAIVTTKLIFILAPPTLTISKPVSGSKWSNDVYTVTGTVKAGTYPISSVQVSVNGVSSPAIVSGTSWTNQVNLTAGTNIITAYALDINNGSSVTNTTKLTFIVVPPSLTITKPTTGSKWSNDVYTVTGTVKAGSYPISSVKVSVNGSTSLASVSGTTWTDQIDLIKGTNTITAYALDINDGSSLTNITKLTFVIVPPTLTITAPKTTGIKWSNNVYTVTGTIKSHTYAASNVVVVVNGSASTATLLSGTNWNEQINLIVGTNTIAAYALDTNNDSSVTDTVKLIYIPISKLSVQIIGDGTLSPKLNNATLIVGDKYSMQATAGTGFGFYFWDVNGFMTNASLLKFTMVSNLDITANFRDVTPPTVTITSPKNGLIFSNALLTVSGTASDKYEPLTQVLVQINGGGWITASGTTSWSIADLAVVHGSNIVEVTALDSAGLYSKTNVLQVFGVPPQGAWAPSSLANTLITLTPNSSSTAPHALCLSAKSFTYSETNAFYTNWGIGQYGFIPVDTNYSVVDLSFTAPTTVAYGDVVLDLAFNNYDTGYYTNEASGEIGSFTIQTQSQLAPTNWSGKSYTLTPQGLTSSDSYTVNFTSASTVTTSGGTGQGSTGTYQVDNASPIASFFVDTLTGGTELSQRYAMTTFTSATGGYYEIEYYEDGVMEKYEIGNFKLK